MAYTAVVHIIQYLLIKLVLDHNLSIIGVKSNPTVLTRDLLQTKIEYLIKFYSKIVTFNMYTHAVSIHISAKAHYFK